MSRWLSLFWILFNSNFPPLSSNRLVQDNQGPLPVLLTFTKFKHRSGLQTANLVSFLSKNVISITLFDASRKTFPISSIKLIDAPIQVFKPEEQEDNEFSVSPHANLTLNPKP